MNFSIYEPPTECFQWCKEQVSELFLNANYAEPLKIMLLTAGILFARHAILKHASLLKISEKEKSFIDKAALSLAFWLNLMFIAYILFFKA